MDKLKFETPDMAAGNIEKIGVLFPSAITEMRGEDGQIRKGINFEVLKQLLSRDVVDGDECYEFTWVGKKAAMAEAARPITKTLRPVKEDSRDWDTTQNLYIEGDNLEVLKILQESYLGKVKMIYIDPPYNTGHDFIYRDKFQRSQQEENEQMGMYDEDENQMFENTEGNGRFHSDWCSMMYSRLATARNLLAEDGVIFISIDEHETETLTKLCDEIFGEINHIGTIIVKSNPRGSMSTSEIASLHENLLLYSKERTVSKVIGHELSNEMTSEYKYSDESGAYRLLGLRMRGGFWRRSERPKLYYPIYINPQNFKVSLEKSDEYCEEALPVQPSTMEDGTWRWSKDKVLNESSHLIGKQVVRGADLVWDVYQKDYLERAEGRRTKAKSIWDESEINYQNGATEIKKLFGKSGIFDYAKPTYLIKQAIKMIGFNNGDIVFDFFSGSATTAHAVMQLNAEDGGHRKFIMVQLPEPCDEKSEAFKAGYKNICEIGKERIRRAGDKIKEDNPLGTQELDIGFRVFRVDSSNMKDVYYQPDELDQQSMFDMVSNIKDDRTDMDLLYACLLDWGVEIHLPHTSTDLDGCTVHNVDNGALMACFSPNVPRSVVEYMAKQQPLRAVFRDSAFASDDAKINVTEIFKNLSPDTKVKVI